MIYDNLFISTTYPKVSTTNNTTHYIWSSIDASKIKVLWINSGIYTLLWIQINDDTHEAVGCTKKRHFGYA